MGWLCVEAGFRKLLAMDPFIASLANRRVPYATVMGWIGGVVEFLGGLALLLGAWTRCAAIAIVVFTIVATLIGHRYWEIAEAAARRMQQSHFVKNLAIIGGILLLCDAGGEVFGGWVAEEVTRSFASVVTWVKAADNGDRGFCRARPSGSHQHRSRRLRREAVHSRDPHLGVARSRHAGCWHDGSGIARRVSAIDP